MNPTNSNAPTAATAEALHNSNTHESYPTFADRARILTGRGIHVVPVDPLQKRCTVPGWPGAASSDDAVISIWQRQNPSYNSAAVAKLDGFCILDCDTLDLIEQIERESGRSMPLTFTVRSAGRGCPHVYFRHTDRSRQLGNRKAAGLFDFKAHNSYVVGPGSQLENGRTYDILSDAPIAEIPDWLVDWLEAHSTAEKPKGYDKMPLLDEAFDFDAFLEHYGIEIRDTDGNWYITDVCPVSKRAHEQSTQTGFYYDGERLGFHCFAGGCPGSSMSVGQVIAYLNRGEGLKLHAPYPGPIWSKAEGAQQQQQQKAQQTVEKFTLTGPAVNGGDFDFVLNPLSDRGRCDGWFPRGDVSLIAASSGGGKSTVMADLLEKQLRGEQVFGHDTNRLPYLVIMEDRSGRSLRRTLQRMRINEQDFPHERLEGPLADGVQAILLRQPTMPAVVFLEGIDLLGDASDGRSVSADLKKLQQIAAHYHVALIGSTGAPKQKAKDRYTSLRDQIIGSTVWARKTETIIVLQKENGSEMDEVTIMTVLPRNGAPEQFRLIWEDGRYREQRPEERQRIEQNTTTQALVDWISGQDTFTRAQVRRAFGNRMNGRRLNERLDAFCRTGLLKSRTRGDSTIFEVQREDQMRGPGQLGHMG